MAWNTAEGEQDVKLKPSLHMQNDEYERYAY